MPDDARTSPARKKKRVLLVDDHPMVRERLAEVIRREPDLAVCGEAEDCQQALEAIKATKPDLAIIDLTLRNSHGIDLIKGVNARHPGLAMLVVSMHDESLHAERVICAGALGYITKQEATKKILLAIRTVLNGGLYLSEKMASQMAARTTAHPRAKGTFAPDKLSNREARVFELIGRGHSTRQIAEELHLDPRTIETYRHRIKDKLNFKDANELLHQAIRWSQGGST